MLGFAVALGGFGLVSGPVCLEMEKKMTRVSINVFVSFGLFWLQWLVVESRGGGGGKEGWMDVLQR